jgi:hypothetical protein
MSLHIFSRVKEFWARYERHVSVLAIVAGFIPDMLALRRVDLLPETILLYSYLAIIGLSIFLIHLTEAEKFRGRIADMLRPWLSLSLHFTFGSLISALLVFYSKGGSLWRSWPFLFFLLSIFIGLEVFKKYGERLVLQMAMYFFAIFSFCVFAVPLWTGSIDTNTFLLSGLVSLLVFGLFSSLLFFTGRKRFKENITRVFLSAIAIYAVINALYFTNVLPPIPLGLKEIGVYHRIEKVPGGYYVQAEIEPWYESFGDPTVHVLSGETVYVFSSVFTPVAIKTDIVHVWERFDPSDHKWIQASAIRFPVSGGRDGGYRGFSLQPSISPGKWRVNVETPQGRLIGRTSFNVLIAAVSPSLVESIR